MKPISAIIIDDEVKASENLAFLINTYCPKIDIVAIYNEPLESINLIKTYKPDLLFLDIEMPQIDGFQLLELIQNSINCKVIFTTAYKEYALNAIKKSASDYLLKPIAISELIKATEKISCEFEKNKENNKPQLLKIASINGFDIVNINDILYLKSENTITHIYYLINNVQKKLVATKTIKHFETLLKDYSFFRLHDSYIVNLNKITQYLKTDGGSVIMHDGLQIDISRRRKQEFLELFLH